MGEKQRCQTFLQWRDRASLKGGKVLDLFNNLNTIVSIIVGCITILTTLTSVLSKRKTVQRAIENPSIPTTVRLRLEDQWTGSALVAKVISGIIKAGLVAVFFTIVVTFMINFFLAFQQFLSDMNTFSRASSYGQAQDVFSHMLVVMGQIFAFSHPLYLLIGAIVGILLGILVGLSTGNRSMPSRLYNIYVSSGTPQRPY